MRVFLLLFLIAVSLFIGIPADASDDLFIQKKTEEETVLDQLEKATNPDAHVQQPLDQLSSEDLVNRYYGFCVAKKDPALNEFSQKLLCSCTAAKMLESMSAENLRAFFTDTKEGAFQRSLAMEFAHMPCMKETTRDTIFESCRSNPANKDSMRHVDAVCQCVADNMSAFATGKGAGLIAAYDRKGIPSPDALAESTLTAFLNSKSYEIKSKQHIRTCLLKHEYGL